MEPRGRKLTTRPRTQSGNERRRIRPWGSLAMRATGDSNTSLILFLRACLLVLRGVVLSCFRNPLAFGFRHACLGEQLQRLSLTFPRAFCPDDFVPSSFTLSLFCNCMISSRSLSFLFFKLADSEVRLLSPSTLRRTISRRRLSVLRFPSKSFLHLYFTDLLAKLVTNRGGYGDGRYQLLIESLWCLRCEKLFQG
eukprot:762781-Hanusia_phi.AAC.19